MTRIITITNQKGGVGKTTTAVHLAHGLALRGKNVLLIDLDPQGQCATSLGINPEEGVFNLLITRGSPRQWVRESGRANLSIIPGDRTTATAQTVINAENRSISAILDAIRPLINDYDYILFDTAPSAGGLQERAIWASGAVLIPTATEFLSSDGLGQIVKMLNALQATQDWKGSLLGVLPTFFDEVSKESKATMEELRSSFGDAVLSPIHRATVVRECAAEAQTVFERDPECRAAQEYSALVDAVVKRM